jgi:hypothetical protein
LSFFVFLRMFQSVATLHFAPDVVTLTDLIISHFDFLNPISTRGFDS